MKVLIIHPYLGSHYKAIIFSALAKISADKDQFELKVLQLFKSEKTREEMEEVDNSLHNYPYDLLSEGSSDDMSWWTRFWSIFKYLRIVKPDVINITGYYDLAVVINAILAKLNGAKLIISIDSTLADNKSSLFKNWIKKSILYMANGFFCYGTKSTDLVKHYIGSKSKVLAEGNAVDNTLIKKIYDSYKTTPEFKSQQKSLRKYNFIFVGRIVPVKNLKVLFDAFKKLNNDDWGLIIAGSGELKKSFEEYSSDINGVTFLEGKPWREVPKFLTLGDVFVLPSYSEAWGLVVNEAMSCELPVLVSKQCGCSVDLVREGENGFTFDHFDEQALWQKMRYFTKNTTALSEMGKNSSEIIKSYTPELVAQRMYKGFIEISE